MNCLSRLVPALLLFLPLSVVAAPAVAQGSGGRASSQLQMTRAELQDLLTRYEHVAQASGQDGDLRMRARYEATLIRNRLDEGDFQVGDQIALRVAGEPALSDTFVVRRDRTLDLPNVGEVPLRGVLRSELEEHLSEQIGRVIRNPIVRAESFIRVSIMGAVSRPGFYVVPADQVLTDALMAAGGPGQGAQLTRMRIERGNERIWGGNALQQAIVEGRTLDQLNLRAGDKIVVPERTPFFRAEYIYAASLLVSLGLTVWRLIAN